ncbi:MAG TPA: alpha/beta hydrolase [Micromonosporaceae bacterium]|nr:alpha/beta hydrolase [Micromonosporaceae bacterium]HCU48868.1 alpha/beta hydrolase [Micromonosporaceae bacterium]
MRVSARGFDFNVFVGGPEGGTAVLLLHGFPQHSGQWDAVTPALHAAGLRTIAFDQRGYSPGARPKDPKDYALTECVADALSIMDSFDVSTFHLVGHDWGAAAAWGLAAMHADRVRTLTAISVPHLTALATAMGDENTDQRTRSSYMWMFADLDKSVPALLADDERQLRGAFVGSGMTDAELERYIGPMRDPAALRGALSWYTAAFAHPAPPLGPVTVPTTYLWSNGDIALGRAAAEACGRFVTADYRFIELDGISHWIPDQAPEATADAILARINGAR